MDYDGVASEIYAIGMSVLPDGGLMKLFSAGIPAGDGPSALKVLAERSATKLGKRELLRKLMSANMRQHKSVETFVYEITNLAAQLSTLHGFSRDEDLILAIFITGLDARYGTLATVLTANEPITFESAVKLVKDFSSNDPRMQSQAVDLTKQANANSG
eukprot:gb/GEZN01005794.1/.p1 GENE.gb/GEZN01005794.1/~~gb/GEZN01005794.1/.p1  ORF type:complete len:159 (+),score=16.84 gb/GEZN01005794.1/:303-779(+)